MSDRNNNQPSENTKLLHDSDMNNEKPQKDVESGNLQNAPKQNESGNVNNNDGKITVDLNDIQNKTKSAITTAMKSDAANQIKKRSCAPSITQFEKKIFECPPSTTNKLVFRYEIGAKCYNTSNYEPYKANHVNIMDIESVLNE